MPNQPDYQYGQRFADLYDLVPGYSSRSDIEFYRELYREHKDSILEVGCGTGRIMIPAALEGCKITGLDISQPMLQQCRRKLSAKGRAIQENVQLICADMRDFELKDKFEIATMPFRVFQHLLRTDEQMSCLRRIHEHLEDGGKLAFDLFHADFARLARNDLGQEIEDTPEYDIGDGRRLRRTYRVLAQHRAEQYSDVELIYYVTDGEGRTERHVEAFPFRYFFRYEVEHLLARTGFRLVQLYGKFDKSPLLDNSPEMIFVAERL